MYMGTGTSIDLKFVSCCADDDLLLTEIASDMLLAGSDNLLDSPEEWQSTLAMSPQLEVEPCEAQLPSTAAAAVADGAVSAAAADEMLERPPGLYPASDLSMEPASAQALPTMTREMSTEIEELLDLPQLSLSPLSSGEQLTTLQVQ